MDNHMAALDLLNRIVEELSQPLSAEMQRDGWTSSAQSGMLKFFEKQRDLVAAGSPNDVRDGLRGLDYAGVQSGRVYQYALEAARLLPARKDA
jgi:hypothetical protein